MSDSTLEFARFNGFRDGVVQVETGDPGLGMGDLRLNGEPRIGDAVILVRRGGTALVCATISLEEGS